MESSGVNFHPPGAQDEPFFDLLQQSAPISVPKVGYSNSSSAYNAPKKMENSTDFNFGGDDVLPSFDFQPNRTTPGSSSSTATGGSSSTAVRIEEGRQGSPPTAYTSYEPMVRRSREPPPTYETPVTRPQEHEKESFDAATTAAVERTMKKYADNLLRVLEGMTGRLSHLESSTQRLENLFEEIKSVIGDTHGEADGKFRSLESHILEVQRGVQVLRDRQELFEAQSQLAKLQLTAKGESASLHSAPSAPPPPPPSPSVSESPSELVRASSGKALMEVPQRQVSESPYYQPQPQLQLQQMPSLPGTTPPPPPPPQHPHPPQQPVQQQLPPQQQHALQQQQQVLPQQQLQQPGVLQNEVSHQTLHQQQPPLPPPAQQQLSHPPQNQNQNQQQHPPQPTHPPPGYSQQPQPTPQPPQQPQPQQQQQQQQQSPYSQQQQPTPQPPPMPSYGPPPDHPSYGQHPQGLHHGSHHVPMPPSSYPSDLPSYHPSYGPPRPGLPPPPPPPSQQPQQPHNVGIYEPSMGRSGSGPLTLPSPQGHSSHYLPPGHSSHYDAQGMNPAGGYPGSSYRLAQPVPSAPSGSGGSSGYPRLPVAQPLPHALPAGGGPPSGNPSLSTNRVPIDEVIDKVTAMGFSKEQVRPVVRRLTENGQSVDLNIVLDKLMNPDSSQAPPKGWFGR